MWKFVHCICSGEPSCRCSLCGIKNRLESFTILFSTFTSKFTVLFNKKVLPKELHETNIHFAIHILGIITNPNSTHIYISYVFLTFRRGTFSYFPTIDSLLICMPLCFNVRILSCILYHYQYSIQAERKALAHTVSLRLTHFYVSRRTFHTFHMVNVGYIIWETEASIIRYTCQGVIATYTWTVYTVLQQYPY